MVCRGREVEFDCVQYADNNFTHTLCDTSTCKETKPQFADRHHEHGSGNNGRSVSSPWKPDVRWCRWRRDYAGRESRRRRYRIVPLTLFYYHEPSAQYSYGYVSRGIPILVPFDSAGQKADSGRSAVWRRLKRMWNRNSAPKKRAAHAFSFQHGWIKRRDLKESLRLFAQCL